MASAQTITRSLAVVILSAILLSGCARIYKSEIKDYRTVATSSVARPKLAKHKHEKAIQHMCDCHYELAEQLLHEALIADASFGPAHNTLGKVYYEQRKFYLAAWEFEHAIKSMPERAEPVSNLGLVYEAVGKLDDAVAQYEEAFAMNTANAEYLGNLLRCRVRRGEAPSAMRTELQSLIELDSRESWVRWAKLKLTTDRSEQDWRNNSQFNDFVLDERVFAAQESVNSLQAPFLPFEANSEPLIPDTAPEIRPNEFSDGEKSATQSMVEELLLPDRE